MILEHISEKDIEETAEHGKHKMEIKDRTYHVCGIKSTEPPGSKNNPRKSSQYTA